MTLLGTLIMIAWGNFLRNYLLRWIIAFIVYYVPIDKEMNFRELNILDFSADGLTVKIQGIARGTAVFMLPTKIQISIKELFLYDLNSSDPFCAIDLPESVTISRKDFNFNQNPLRLTILKQDRSQEIVCRMILGLKQSNIRVEFVGDFDFGLIKVSNLALKKIIDLDKIRNASKSTNSQVIPNMIFKPMPVMPNL